MSTDRGGPTRFLRLGSDILVLCYHAVSPTWGAASSVTPDALERQLAWLVGKRWRGATFHDAVLNRPTGRTLVVSFDDAFVSVLHRAYPILSALGLPATVFAPTSFMSRRQSLSWPGIETWGQTNVAELESMCWDDLGVLAEAGWEIGSHTRTHPHLTQLGDELVRAELADSRADVARHLGHPCQTIAYPYGDVDDRVAEFAKAAGYAAGAALTARLPNLGSLRWPRVGVYQTDAMWRFRAKASRTTRLLRATSLWPREYSLSRSS
jgi:peptidoglycan/xylan/chitin deacetylase (PgdA/CDA1 family)